MYFADSVATSLSQILEAKMEWLVTQKNKCFFLPEKSLKMNETENKVFCRFLVSAQHRVKSWKLKWSGMSHKIWNKNKTHLFDLLLARKKLVNELTNFVFFLNLQILSVDRASNQTLEAEMKCRVTQKWNKNKTCFFNLQIARNKVSE